MFQELRFVRGRDGKSILQQRAYPNVQNSYPEWEDVPTVQAPNKKITIDRDILECALKSSGIMYTNIGTSQFGELCKALGI